MFTKEIIYKTLGYKVKLVCPIETIREITWTGPPNYTIYTVGTDVSKRVSNAEEIDAIDKGYILVINPFTEDRSGKFSCTDGDKEREFNLAIKSKNCKHYLFSYFTIHIYVYLNVCFFFVYPQG